MTLSPPVVNDWPARYIPDAADFNLYINNAISFLQAPPILRAAQLTSTSMGLGWSSVVCDTVREDSYSGYNAITGTYVAQVPGWYSASTTIMLAGTGSGPQGGAGFVLRLDGIQSLIPFEGGNETSDFTPNTWEATLDVYLNVGDWILPAFRNMGSIFYNTSVSGTSDGNCSYFSLAWFSE